MDDRRNFFGWITVKRFMDYALVSTITYGLSFILVLGIVSVPSNLIWFLPLDLLYIASIPFLIIYPQLLFTRLVRNWKDETSKQIRQDIALAGADAARESTFREKLRVIDEDVPEQIYNWRGIAAQGFAVSIALATLLFTMLQYIVSRNQN